MPNHVRNRLIIKADESLVKKITDFLMGEPEEDGSPCHIDFNKITPMPEDLMGESGSDGDWGLAILQRKEHVGRPYKEHKKQFDELKPERKNKILKLGQKYRDNKKKYGYKTWYDWCVANWGTKWNAYNQEKPAANEIWFDTAWSCVHRLILKLSQMFPDATFDYTFADEDTGANCGAIILKNGKGKMLVPDIGSREAYEIAFVMRPEIKSWFRFDGTTYQYKGEEDYDA
jgi:hypothetical protein